MKNMKNYVKKYIKKYIKKIKNKEGFTLVELLATMVILGVITTLSIPVIRNINSNNEQKKYTTYGDTILEAAKIYNDRYSADLFGNSESCTKCVSVNKLMEKKLIEDISIDGMSCINQKYSFVKITKDKDKYKYDYYLSCGKWTTDATYGGKVEDADIQLYFENGTKKEVSAKQGSDSSMCNSNCVYPTVTPGGVSPSLDPGGDGGEPTEPTFLTNYIKSIVTGSPTNSTNIITKNSSDASCTNTFAYDGTGDNNLRYVGEEPCNYVKFNNELWRIVGVMNNIENASGTKETRVKIVRNESLGDYSWDTFAEYTTTSTGLDGKPVTSTLRGLGHNAWAEADIQKELNGDYLNYKTSGTTTWYNGEEDKKDATYEYKKGLTTAAQNLIEPAKWYLGSIDTGRPKVLAAYEAERGSQVYPFTPRLQGTLYGLCEGYGCPRVLSWTGKVGLIYLSDLGFAYGGSLRNECLNSNMYNHSKSDDNDWSAYECTENYLVDSQKHWTITTGTLSTEVFKYLKDKGSVRSSGEAADAVGINPSVYLKSSILFKSGTGSQSNPYQIE